MTTTSGICFALLHNISLSVCNRGTSHCIDKLHIQGDPEK